MLVKIIDGEGALQEGLYWASVGVPTDHSGSIADGALAQVLMPANADRAGWLVACVGPGALYVNEVGAAASEAVADGDGSIVLTPGQSFPPCGYPIIQGAISVIGPTGTAFVAREW